MCTTATARVSSLESLCLENFAFNIVRHGEKKKNIRMDEDIGTLYKVFESWYTADLWKVLERMYVTGQLMKNEPLRRFHMFIAYGIPWESLESCLALLFNEHTGRLCFDLSIGVSGALFHKAFSLSKNLKFLTVKFYGYEEITDPILPLQNCTNLVHIDLMYCHCYETTAILIMRQCLNLQTFKASGYHISPHFLFNLCNKYTGCESLGPVCPGNCNDVGKQLRCLVLYGTFATYYAAACALRHLPSLEIFSDTSYGLYYSVTAVPDAIAYLSSQSLTEGRHPPTLNLRSLYIPAECDTKKISNILKCCPHLKSVCYNVSFPRENFFPAHSFHLITAVYLYDSVQPILKSQEFQNFLSMKGRQLECVALCGYNEVLNIECIIDVLTQCTNLKRLFLSCFTVTTYREVFPVFKTSSCLQHVQKLSLIDLTIENEMASNFFSDLLCALQKVKRLSISSTLAETALITAMKVNRFLSMQELYICDGSVGNILLKGFIHSKSSLRSINLVNCSEEETFVKVHKNFIEQYNLALDIRSFKAKNLKNSEVLYDIYG